MMEGTLFLSSGELEFGHLADEHLHIERRCERLVERQVYRLSAAGAASPFYGWY